MFLSIFQSKVTRNDWKSLASNTVLNFKFKKIAPLMFKSRQVLLSSINLKFIKSNFYLIQTQCTKGSFDGPLSSNNETYYLLVIMIGKFSCREQFDSDSGIMRVIIDDYAFTHIRFWSSFGYRKKKKRTSILKI